MQRYSVDIIAEQKDYQNEPDLILHWAVGRRSPSEWAKPEDQFLPPGSKRFDANCVQSYFQKNVVYPEYRSLHISLEWLTADKDRAVQAINFVLLEPKKNWWHNNNKQNFQIPLALTPATKNENESSNIDPELLALGKRLADVA